MAKKVVIAGACRTAIGKMGGVLSTVPAVDMGSIVIKEALKRAGVPADQVDHVYMGCVIQAGLGQNVARQASLNAGLPIETPAVTVNVVCGSGLNCVNMAAQMIQAGDADIVVAGGMESMSMAPFALPKARFGYRMNNGTLVDTMVNDALTDAFNHYHMMITAENVAEQWGLTREELDEFAAASQQKAVAAQESGRFKDEIVPVEVKQRKKTVIVDTDEGPRAGTTAESLAGLRCCSGKEGGMVTAGNASGINDGAAAVVVMSEEKAKDVEYTFHDWIPDTARKRKRWPLLPCNSKPGNSKYHNRTDSYIVSAGSKKRRKNGRTVLPGTAWGKSSRGGKSFGFIFAEDSQRTRYLCAEITERKFLSWNSAWNLKL